MTSLKNLVSQGAHGCVFSLANVSNALSANQYQGGSDYILIRNPKIIRLGLISAIALLLLLPAQGQQRGGGGSASGGGRSGGGGARADKSTLQVGDEAPDFTLKDLDGKDMTLSSFEGKSPVVLIFGSYT